MSREEIKTLGLLSGGLDSTIAVKLMKKLGYHITVLNFMSPFCNCTKKSNGCKSAAQKVATESGVEIKTIFMGDEYLQMLREPKHGYGKGLNPCVDCRIMMFGRAKKVMEEIGAKFIFTGEVLSQRPMSQMRNRMRQIEKESGLKGMIVRPLSAALLEPTIPEMEGWIDREEMLAISGRSRKPQIEIGREMGMSEEEFCSSGGCMLTDMNFAARMKDLFGHSEKSSVKDARLLRYGRHFRISDGCKVIVGRNKNENEKLFKMVSNGDTLVRVKDYAGPCVIIKGEIENGHGVVAGRIAARYSAAPGDEEVGVEIHKAGSDEMTTLTVMPMPDEELEKFRI